MVLDLNTFEYRPSAKPALPSLEMAKNAATVQERLKLLLANDPEKDKAAAFLWPFLSSLWNFAAERIGEAANDAPSIDQAMRAGFNWEMGPFEMWDAAGVRETVEPHEDAGHCLCSTQCRVCWIPRRSQRPCRGIRRTGRNATTRLQARGSRSQQQPGHARVADYRRDAWRGAEQSGRIAGGYRRRHWLHRTAFAEECDRRRCGGDDFVGAESVVGCGEEILRGL